MQCDANARKNKLFKENKPAPLSLSRHEAVASLDSINLWYTRNA